MPQDVSHCNWRKGRTRIGNRKIWKIFQHLPNILISFILSTLISTSRKYLSLPVLPSIAHIAAKLRTTLAKRIFPRLEDLKVFGCLVLGLTQKEYFQYLKIQKCSVVLSLVWGLLVHLASVGTDETLLEHV